MQRLVQPIEIMLNGEASRVEGPTTVAALVRLRNPRPPFAVEVNRQLVRHGEYERTAVRQGDRVEIVTLVGGG